MLNLQSITPDTIPLLRSYLDRYPRESCDYSICNLMTWGKLYNDQYLIWKDNLVIFNPKYHAICFPVGENFEPHELVDLIQLFAADYQDSQLMLMPAAYYAAHPELDNSLLLSTSDVWDDYIYLTEQLVSLSGKKLAKKKNLISQFKRLYPDYKVLPITSRHREEIVTFAYDWKRSREIEGIYLQTELKALENAMEMWDEIPIQGILICYHHHVAAFSIFSEQTPDMATIHFEKFDPDKKGSAQVINYEAAKYLLPKYKWINREQDMGLEGLRQAKKSYLPNRMIPFYTARLKHQHHGGELIDKLFI